MNFTEFETERFLFRKLRESDFPIVYDWLGNNENMKFRKSTLSEEETHKYLDWAISNSNEEECKNFEFATIIKETGALIGVASIFNLDIEPELGWTIHRNYWRQGYGTEIGTELLNFAFGTLGLRRIIADAEWCDRFQYAILWEEWKKLRCNLTTERKMYVE
ncbi:MAG: GCN5-related N-acetyltransferase [Clostridiales bacterium]|nr:GCN5-related N-acetyltransferase [Clostridiales bacterium]